MKVRVGQFLYTTLFSPIIDTIFPPLCVLCDTLLPAERKIVCPSCMTKLVPAGEQIELPIQNRSFKYTYILFQYDEHIRQLIHLLKYKRCLTLTRYFSLSADNHIKLLSSYSIIIPVPLHPVKRRERGYNQSAEIARQLSQVFRIDFDETVLIRKRFTPSQTKLSREERAQNMKDAFVCAKDLTGVTILLVDDVVTTGNTVEACAAELKRAGADQVDVFALANPTLRQSQIDF
jgi:ComF family protein